MKPNATPETFADRLRAKLKAASKGEPNTWGFVAMFMEMIGEVEQECAVSEIGKVQPQERAAGSAARPQSDGNAHRAQVPSSSDKHDARGPTPAEVANAPITQKLMLELLDRPEVAAAKVKGEVPQLQAGIVALFQALTDCGIHAARLERELAVANARAFPSAELSRDDVPRWALEELRADCNYHLYGRCDTAACHRTNGCAIAHVLHARLNPSHVVNIAALVNRFLGWPLPDSVCSDMCATKQGYPSRVGTNLLTAVEARQMLEHVLAGLIPSAGGAIERWQVLECVNQYLARVVKLGGDTGEVSSLALTDWLMDRFTKSHGGAVERRCWTGNPCGTDTIMLRKGEEHHDCPSGECYWRLRDQVLKNHSPESGKQHG